MKDQQWTIIRVLKWTTEYFASRGIEQPRTDAEVLLAHVLGYKRLDLYLNFDQPLTKRELATYREAIKRRAKREPVQYITGEQEFWSLPIKVTPAVLIPRPETECLVEKALEVARKLQICGKITHILEIGTGSGAISLALAKELQNVLVFATDISPEALALARQNAINLNLHSKITFFASNLYDSLGSGAREYFDIIVSNPPYISEEEYEKLPPEIRDFEPRKALFGGKDGVSVTREIILSGGKYLKPGGTMLLEIGYSQGQTFKDFAKSIAWISHVKIHRDYSGLDRVLALGKK